MNAIDLTGPAGTIERVVALAKNHGDVNGVSEPTSLDASKALSMGLPHVDVETAKAILEFITVVLNTGAAGFGFYSAIRDALKGQDEVLAVSDSKTGTVRGHISGATTDVALRQLSS
jgi:hypothetical protein